MAEKRPLAWYDDSQFAEELRAGDTLPGGGSGDDDNSGRYFVPAATTYTIEENFQSIVKGGILDVEGSVIVDGQLYMEV